MVVLKANKHLKVVFWEAKTHYDWWRSLFFYLGSVCNGGTVIAVLSIGETLSERRMRPFHTSKKFQDTHRISFCHIHFFNSVSDSFFFFCSMSLWSRDHWYYYWCSGWVWVLLLNKTKQKNKTCFKLLAVCSCLFCFHCLWCLFLQIFQPVQRSLLLRAGVPVQAGNLCGSCCTFDDQLQICRMQIIF